MYFEFIPYKSIGPISFGMTVEQVRALFGSAPRQNSHIMVEVPSDEWENLGIRVDYSPTGTCEAVLLAAPIAKPTLFERSLLGDPHRDLCRWIREIDPKAVFPQEDESTLLSLKHGFMLGEPRADEPEETRTGLAVLVWEAGYWDGTEFASQFSSYRDT